MNLRGLLLGSAAGLVAVSGAQAADAVVIAEPEPMEYVRICDMYGSGFFYIPGTETCLKISGYVRAEWLSDREGRRGFVRFAPTFDVRSDTEFGTLTSFAEIYFNWERVVGVGYVDSVEVYTAYIELGDTFKARIGKGETPAQWLLEWGGYGAHDGFYNAVNSGYLMLSYDFGNGLQVLAAAVEDPDADWAPDVEVGIRYDIPGMEETWVGAIGTYDEVAEDFTAQIGAQVKLASLPVKLKANAFYSELGSKYAVTDPNGTPVEWSVLGAAAISFHEKAELQALAQWFDNGAWFFAGGVKVTPVENLYVLPEVTYASRGPSSGRWGGRLRVQRDF
jgi:hypothetical protein